MSKLLEISEVSDLKKNWKIFEDTELGLTEEDKKNIVIINYEKGDFANKEAIIALFYKPQINKLKKQLRKIQSYARNKGFVFQGANTDKSDLIKGIYKDWEDKNLKKQLVKDSNSTEIKKTDVIFENALKVGASDIHLEKRRDKTKLR